MALSDRIKNAWDAFLNKDPTRLEFKDLGMGATYRPDRIRFRPGTDRTVVNSIYNRIAMDVASVDIEHVRLDENWRYSEDMKSYLEECLTVEANIDQTGRALVQDIAMSMFDEGVVAVVPVETYHNPINQGSWDVLQLRTAKIVQWYPEHIRVDLYNQREGKRQEITLPKSMCAIIENPFYYVMNEPNSIMQRLIRKMSLLDIVDEESNNGKLNMIIQLPYIIKTEGRKRQAEQRRKDIEMQLSSSKYGIAYTDGTEKITQLGHSYDNNLLDQVKYLTDLAYSQLGLTVEILNGTADEKAMTNYYNRTVEPVLTAIVEEMTRKFLTPTARTQRQAVKYFRDPFKIVATTQLAELANAFTRNEIMTANEFRQIVGLKPALDPGADELRNKNMPIQEEGEAEIAEDEMAVDVEGLTGSIDEMEAAGNARLDEVDEQIAALEKELKHAQYASEYYDPVKAHEYYEEHKKLKGRTKTHKLNEEGQSDAAYIKEQLYGERDKKIQQEKDIHASNKDSSAANRDRLIENRTDQLSSDIESENNKLSKDIESSANRMESKIEDIRNRLDGLEGDELQYEKAKALKEIEKLKDDNKNERAKLKEGALANKDKLRGEAQADKGSYRSNYRSDVDTSKNTMNTNISKIKSDYQKKYANEMGKLLSDSSKIEAIKKASTKKAKEKKTKYKYW